MELVKNYRHNEVLRRSFNALTEQTFGFHFEDWYRLGYWREDYVPYSIVEEGQVVANVSVNHTNFLYRGELIRLVQLGTVMTHPDYRGQGLIRRLMEEIEEDYAARVDGMYLFANDEVLDFYPKFGFRTGRERQYARGLENTGRCTMQRRSMTDKGNRDAFERALSAGMVGAFPMVGNAGLTFFYISSFMSECVWYSPALSAWAIAELEGEELTLHAVCGASTDAAAAAFGSQVRQVKLKYVPECAQGWERSLLQEEDCTFFVKGEFFESFEKDGLRIPALSHA